MILMSRRHAATKRPVQNDPVYGNKLVAIFINQVMRNGKKSIAEKIVYGAFEAIKARIKNSDPIEIFERALEHIKPVVEVKSRRVGGATYQVPVEIQVSRALTLAMRWLIEFASKRGEKNMMLKLAGEIIDAADEDSSTGGSTGKGGAIKKREDTHRMAEANKAFAHYRW